MTFQAHNEPCQLQNSTVNLRSRSVDDLSSSEESFVYGFMRSTVSTAVNRVLRVNVLCTEDDKIAS